MSAQGADPRRHSKPSLWAEWIKWRGNSQNSMRRLRCACEYLADKPVVGGLGLAAGRKPRPR